MNFSSGVPIFWNLLFTGNGVLGVFGSKHESSSKGFGFGFVSVLTLTGERTFLEGIFSVFFLSPTGDELTKLAEFSFWFEDSPMHVSIYQI